MDAGLCVLAVCQENGVLSVRTGASMGVLVSRCVVVQWSLKVDASLCGLVVCEGVCLVGPEGGCKRVCACSLRR